MVQPAPFIISNLTDHINLTHPNKYNFGFSYFIKLVNKNITMVNNYSAANILFLFGIGTEF